VHEALVDVAEGRSRALRQLQVPVLLGGRERAAPGAPAEVADEFSDAGGVVHAGRLAADESVAARRIAENRAQERQERILELLDAAHRHRIVRRADAGEAVARRVLLRVAERRNVAEKLVEGRFELRSGEKAHPAEGGRPRPRNASSGAPGGGHASGGG
jgi:hypothetical protein